MLQLLHPRSPDQHGVGIPSDYLPPYALKIKLVILQNQYVGNSFHKAVARWLIKRPVINKYVTSLKQKANMVTLKLVVIQASKRSNQHYACFHTF